MDFSLTGEQVALVRTVEEFARREVQPGAAERDLTGKWDPVLWHKMGEIGLLGLSLPEEYGGGGADAVTTFAAGEAFCRGGLDSGLHLSWGAHLFLCAMPLYAAGTEEQRKKYLPPMCRGDWVGAMGLTEPEAGSDAAGLRTAACLQGDHYVLNGTKMFITNGPVAQVVLVLANIDPARGKAGITGFLVEKGTQGFLVGRELDKLGHRSSPTGELIFEDCSIPVANRLGAEGEGWSIVEGIFFWERGVFLSSDIGFLSALLDMAIDYARTRRQFGRSIGDFQLVKEQLVEMKLSLEASRLLAYRAAWAIDRGDDTGATRAEAALAKLAAAEALMRGAYQALQIFGGYGYMREYPVERLFRDARLLAIGGGTSEIQKIVVANHLLKA